MVAQRPHHPPELRVRPLWDVRVRARRPLRPLRHVPRRRRHRLRASHLLLNLVLVHTLTPPQSFWGNLFWCQNFWQCRMLTVLVAFSWMCWVVVFALLFISAVFAVTNAALGRPLHARYDPTASWYRTSRAF